MIKRNISYWLSCEWIPSSTYLLKKAQSIKPSHLIERYVYCDTLHIAFHNPNLSSKIPGQNSESVSMTARARQIMNKDLWSYKEKMMPMC